jgi:hypothetical protein
MSLKTMSETYDFFTDNNTVDPYCHCWSYGNYNAIIILKNTFMTSKTPRCTRDHPSPRPSLLSRLHLWLMKETGFWPLENVFSSNMKNLSCVYMV